MPSVITRKYEEWAAQRTANNLPARPDTFVFAYIDGQSETEGVSRDEGLPFANQIVYRTPVLQYGMLNKDSVVYSALLDTTVGDFDYNWIGLLDSTSNTLCMVVHTGTQKKIKTSAAGQGNTISRSLAMEFTGAAAVSQITVTPATWQIDFSARLFGIDERLRLSNFDRYGAAGFNGNAYLITGATGAFKISAGVGYVGGLRAEQTAQASLAVAALPAVIWIDVSLQGQVTSRWDSVVSVAPGNALVNYTDAQGFKHYVAPLASIDADGNITDLRPKGTLAEQNAETNYLRKDKNLNDVNDKGAARTNLDIYAKGDVYKKSETYNRDELYTRVEGNSRYLVKADGGTITGKTTFDYQDFIEKNGTSEGGGYRHAYGLRVTGAGAFRVEFYHQEVIGQYTQAIISVTGSGGKSYPFRFKDNGHFVASQFEPDDFSNFDVRYDARYDERFNPRFVYKTEGVIDMRQGSAGTMSITHDAWVRAPSGCALTGYYFEGDNPENDTLEYKPLQININGAWRTIAG